TTVLINQQADPETDHLYSVDADDYAGAREAVEHLLALGHRRIGYLGVDNRYQSNARRLQGYRDTLAAAGITPPEEWRRTIPSHRFHTEHDVVEAQALLPELLQAGVTAVFCYNDLSALGLLAEAHRQGLRLPDQLAVVGFDNVPYAELSLPSLTTVDQRKEELGRLAVTTILAARRGEPVADIRLRGDLILRASTCPPG
ncbi:MAG: substrate-binding domain-containing protein, partial [Caldilineales bacterium]|nr:substrate-binding domain-containing protein [Caldilineales bacterium]